ncbi:Flp pilus assembly protein CpaB [Pusillimonas minor]|uniref:Flp pilus assembly protein CpaB n=1 Tax=Pusillimonas minor TaxID=2697024 RepID=A0A842HNI7_9BURK|nr:Flp pilus assembly protein CpaB [Pusillimonas minor]MBC2769282.1 Flp pilus assembly protein CpaB [Pusillimonas minor]
MQLFARRLPVAGRTLAVWGLALASGVFAALAAQRHLDQKVRQLEAAASVPTVGRIVAAFDLPAGTLLDTSHLATRQYPRALVSSDSMPPERVSYVVGQVLTVALKAGDAIGAAHTRGAGPPPFSSQLGVGRRAITMPVDAINAVAGLLKPGDLIDLYVSFDYQRRRITAPLLQGVQVLATGLDTMAADGQPLRADSGGFATVTLDTSPEDAVKLVAARQGGVITSVLRRSDDAHSSRKAVRGDLASLLGVARPPPLNLRPKRAPVIYGSTGKLTLPGLNPLAPAVRQESGVFDLPARPRLVRVSPEASPGFAPGHETGQHVEDDTYDAEDGAGEPQAADGETQ